MAERLQKQMLATGGGAPVGAFGNDPQLAAGDGAGNAPRSASTDAPKVGRNDACPCGSGKKYKHCHGQLV
jgi:preprotein translocase subunit SecA